MCLRIRMPQPVLFSMIPKTKVDEGRIHLVFVEDIKRMFAIDCVDGQLRVCLIIDNHFL